MLPGKAVRLFLQKSFWYQIRYRHLIMRAPLICHSITSSGFARITSFLGINWYRSARTGLVMAERVAESNNHSDEIESRQGSASLEVDYAGGQRTWRDSVSETFNNIYRSIFDQSARPELENTDVYDKVKKLVLSPNLDMASLQSGLNDILQGHGIPKVKLEELSESHSGSGICGDNCGIPEGARLGAYFTGEGSIGINTQIFKTGNMVQLGKTVLHEANHHMQDILLTRAIMDEVARNKSPNFLESVSQIYTQRFGRKPLDSFLQDVEKFRGGKELSPAEQQRANWLAEGWIARAQDAQRPNAKADLDTMKQFAKMLQDGGTNPKEMAEKLLAALDPANDSDPDAQRLRRLFFANEPFSSRQFKKQFGDPNSSSFDSKTAFRAFKDFIDLQIQRLEKSEYLQFVNMRNYSHEIESYDLADAFLAHIRKR